MIYETHVRGFTHAAPGGAGDAARHLRGPGAATRCIELHAQSLGVTAVELLPIHAFVDDSTCSRRG